MKIYKAIQKGMKNEIKIIEINGKSKKFLFKFKR